jgi:HK97 family phage portal protein
VGIFDWLGPLGFGGKARGWDALPALPAEQKALGLPSYQDYGAALTVGTLVSGPGASDIGAGWRGNTNNSAVFACLQAIGTAIAEPELQLYRVQAGEKVEVDDSPFADLMRRPNPHMSLDTLLWYLASCLKVDGNGYWHKLRAGDPLTGNVVEVWPISPTRIVPVTAKGSPNFIDVYRYHLAPGVDVDLPIENVVHFRTGLDDADHRLGAAPLKRLVREVSSDEAATKYADRLLMNFAAPGLSVEWPDTAAPISQELAEEIKHRIQSAYAGDNVGAVSVMSPGAKLSSHGFSPEQMDLKALHRVPEERISAVLGVPAIVAGLGAGLDHATYSNVAQAREAFTEMCLIPLWRAIAATITLQLLPDFTSEKNAVVDFDISEVRALADDENAKAVRLDILVRSAQLTLNEARAQQGLDPLEGADVLLVPGAWAPTMPSELGAVATPAPLPLPARVPPAAASWRLRSVKAIDDLPREYDDLKAEVGPEWEAELAAFLVSQGRRVNRRLAAGADMAEDLVPDAEAVLLRETLTPLQRALLGQVERLVVAELGIDFQVDDPATRVYLASAGQNIVGITQTTRSAVQAALIEGQHAGEGIEQLARRLRGLPSFDAARGRVCARTELGTSQNLAAISSYRASGVVVGVRVLDGDSDAACAAMNGRTFALGQEPAALQHPNCVRAFAPVLDAEELTRSA